MIVIVRIHVPKRRIGKLYFFVLFALYYYLFHFFLQFKRENIRKREKCGVLNCFFIYLFWGDGGGGVNGNKHSLEHCSYTLYCHFDVSSLRQASSCDYICGSCTTLVKKWIHLLSAVLFLWLLAFSISMK